MTATVASGEQRAISPLAAPIACGCCLLAGAAYVAADNPADGGVFLPCPFRALTGWWCPGCGMTRATHHLFRGDLVQALRYNLFVIAILVGLTLTWLAWLLHSAGKLPRRAADIPVWAQIAAVAVLLAFAVVRNMPGVGGLRG